MENGTHKRHSLELTNGTHWNSQWNSLELTMELTGTHKWHSMELMELTGTHVSALPSHKMELTGTHVSPRSSVFLTTASRDLHLVFTSAISTNSSHLSLSLDNEACIHHCRLHLARNRRTRLGRPPPVGPPNSALAAFCCGLPTTLATSTSSALLSVTTRNGSRRSQINHACAAKGLLEAREDRNHCRPPC